jgi:hypothetical protein
MLIPFLVSVVAFLLGLIETYLYYRFNEWYYRSGPAVVRESWQTKGSVEAVYRAVRPHLRADGMAGAERSAGFCLRQRWWVHNIWPRVWLGVEEAEEGAVLRFAVRPFCSFTFGLIPVAILMAAAVRRLVLVRLTLASLAAVLLFLLLYFTWLMRKNIAHIGRLRTIRQALASHGLHVCDRCGYDLFAHAPGSRCPECGWSESNTIATDSETRISP